MDNIIDNIMQSKMTIDGNGDKFWIVNNKLHRTDGPAVVWTDGSKFWYVNNKLHRTDGPAIEFASGNIIWRLYGTYLTFGAWLDQNTELTDDEKVMFKLQYG